MDAVPGRYTTMWFEATQAGRVPPVLRRVLRHEPLGDDRQGHRRWSRRAFQTWLAGGKADRHAGRARRQGLHRLGCVTCHLRDGQGRGPSLRGVFGSQVTLANGEKVIADEDYIRESILTPTAKIVAGYPAADADLPGRRQRGADRSAHRLHQVARRALQAGSRHACGGTRRRRRTARPPRHRARRLQAAAHSENDYGSLDRASRRTT